MMLRTTNIKYTGTALLLIFTLSKIGLLIPALIQTLHLPQYYFSHFIDKLKRI